MSAVNSFWLDCLYQGQRTRVDQVPNPPPNYCSLNRLHYSVCRRDSDETGKANLVPKNAMLKLDMAARLNTYRSWSIKGYNTGNIFFEIHKKKNHNFICITFPTGTISNFVWETMSTYVLVPSSVLWIVRQKSYSVIYKIILAINKLIMSFLH